MTDLEEPCLLQSKHAALLARAQAYKAEAAEAAAAMASFKDLAPVRSAKNVPEPGQECGGLKGLADSGDPVGSSEDTPEVSRLRAELAAAVSSNAEFSAELSILRAGGQRPVATEEETMDRAEAATAAAAAAAASPARLRQGSVFSDTGGPEGTPRTALDVQLSPSGSEASRGRVGLQYSPGNNSGWYMNSPPQRGATFYIEQEAPIDPYCNNGVLEDSAQQPSDLSRTPLSQSQQQVRASLQQMSTVSADGYRVLDPMPQLIDNPAGPRMLEDHGTQLTADPWGSRMIDWQSSLDRLQRDTQASNGIAAYAQRLGRAAGFAVELGKENSLKLRIEELERELMAVQGAEVLEQAALRRDEAWLVSLRKDLSDAEASLHDIEGQATRDAAEVVAGGVVGNAGDRLLAQLINREASKVESVQEESANFRAAAAQTQVLTARRKREALLIDDAYKAALVLLEAGPELLDSRADALRRALVRTQNDIELLKEAGRGVLQRSVEVADEFNAAEAELQAERAERELASQHEYAAALAADEQQRVSQLCGSSSLRVQ